MSLEHPKKENNIEKKKITSFETAKGSIYQYLPDGRTQRFKKIENKTCEPQDVIVFLPDWKSLTLIAPKDFLEKLGENQIQYQQTVLDYAQKKKVYIVDQNGKKISSNKEKMSAQQVFMAFLEKGANKADFIIPVAVDPRENFSPYDTRKYVDPIDGELKRDQHIGNKVIKINY